MDWHQWVRPHCVTSPWLLVAMVATNGWIAYSYLRIPRIIKRILREVGYPRIVLPGAPEAYGTAIFIASCGVTHLFSVAVLFCPSLDWLAISWALWTGGISWWTARRLHKAERLIIATALEAQTFAGRVDG